jgi:uncharacterized protein YcfJ
MKTMIAMSLAGILTTVSGVSLAQHGPYGYSDGNYARARVLRVEPITSSVRVAVPHRECYQQEVRTPVYINRSGGAALVGGVVGGILGHNLAHGRHRGGATIAGSIIGAAIGKSMAQGRDSYYEDVSYVDRCEVHTAYELQERLEGYNVTYRYRSEVYQTRMNYDPSKFIMVRVNVSPVVY